jgi:hypothetical protein
MATQYAFGKIVTNGLILALDAADRNSYPGSGNTWTDVSGNGNNLTSFNNVTYNAAQGGNFTFVSSSSSRISTAGTNINAGSNFSVFAWINPSPAINVRNAIVGNSYPYSSTQGFYFATATAYGGNINTFFISIGNDNAYATATNNSLVTGSWNYIGGTVTNGGAAINLYANGIQTGYQGQILTTNTVTYLTNQFHIGQRVLGNSEYFTGSIANVQIYNRVLSTAEVAQNYNAQKLRFGLK